MAIVPRLFCCLLRFCMIFLGFDTHDTHGGGGGPGGGGCI